MSKNRQPLTTGSPNVAKRPAGWMAWLLVSFAGSTVALAQPQVRNPGPIGGMPMAGQPEGEADAKDKARVKVDDNDIVDLHVNDEDLANVLEMLSIQSQKNIIAGKNVSARVTANLYGVTFWEALDSILNVNGYGYKVNGNFIYVYTLDELAKMEQAARLQVSKVLPLNYLSSVDAAEFVKPLLSERGQIKTNGKTGSFPSLPDTPIGAEDFANTSLLVVYDYEENVAEIEALIRQIDTRPAQVLVEATILQTSLNEANAFGVDFSIIADMDFGEFVSLGGPLQAANSLITGRGGSTGGTGGTGAGRIPADGGASAISTNVGNVAGPGGLKVGIVSNDVAVFLRVLDEVTDTTVLSNPKILALNRQASRVLVGRKVGYISTTSTDTATTQTVEFLDTGTQLYFRPFVTNEGMIRMELKPQVSEAVIREVNDATGAAVTIPDEITNELVTNVMVRDGQTVVLGGLFREATASTRRQVPFLGDIPILGAAFRGNDDSTERNEIIFLITPTIVNDTALTESGQRGMAYVDHARAGAREGVLPWSRDRLTTRLNVEAEKLAREGDTEKALWKVQRSLSLNSNQPEVIGLRERISGEKSPWPTRSFLDRVIHGEGHVTKPQSFNFDFTPEIVPDPLAMPETANATNFDGAFNGATTFNNSEVSNSGNINSANGAGFSGNFNSTFDSNNNFNNSTTTNPGTTGTQGAFVDQNSNVNNQSFNASNFNTTNANNSTANSEFHPGWHVAGNAEEFAIQQRTAAMWLGRKGLAGNFRAFFGGNAEWTAPAVTSVPESTEFSPDANK